jgi:hypothetical protein
MAERPERSPAAEAEDLEIRSAFTRSQQDRGALVKTIVAMANTRGGRILLQAVEGNRDALDSAHVAALVNEYVAPPVQGIESRAVAEHALEIAVPESVHKPHVFVGELQFQHRGRTRGAFFAGQVWVRRASRNEPAGAADIERVIRERTSRALAGLSDAINDPSFPLQIDAAAGWPAPAAEQPAPGAVEPDALLRVEPHAQLAIRVTTDPGATAVNIDINRTYPFTTSALGAAVGKGTNWAAAAARALSLKGDLLHHYAVRNADGRVVMNRYSEAALQKLRAKLAAEPLWNPWSA